MTFFQGLCAPPFGSEASCSAHPAPGQYDIQIRNWADKSSATGLTQPQAVEFAAKYDLGHSHASFEAMCDPQVSQGPCRMDGAAGIRCLGTCPTQPQFRFVENSKGTLDPYLRLATEYGWANRMFQTNQRPSFPAHQFIFGGTSAPTAGDDAMGVFAAENTGAQDAGCAAPPGSAVRLIDPSGLENRVMYPCFEHPTMADLLPVTWKYYAPTPGSIWTAPNAIRHICQSSGLGGKCTGADWIGNVDLVPAHVLSDIDHCRLAAVSWVVPTAANSDHARVNDGAGPSWVASIVNAIGASSACDSGAGYWSDTAVVITWDDWGGWYDHVAPAIPAGPEGDYQYGFRVPLIFVSACTRRGMIDNATYDFGSILKFVERNFGVREGALFFADARAENDLRAFYDLEKTPRPYYAVPAPLSADYFLSDTRPGVGPDAD